MDVALIGPNYQPGHAHADVLSFELSLFGQRLLVNIGTSEYRLTQSGNMSEAQKPIILLRLTIKTLLKYGVDFVWLGAHILLILKSKS